MEQKIRPVIGVAAAQVSDIEQREILEGIIEEAQKAGFDIAVISNIYNPVEHSDVLCCEKKSTTCFYLLSLTALYSFQKYLSAVKFTI